MSIILAIEPDRRRGTQLTAMARAHLRAELLVAPTAAQAIEALDGRIPDVLLTAPLLPSHEEAAMAEHLRQLGPDAGHVQTLTIPLLAGGGDRERPVLSTFRRDRGNRNRTEPEGCDPAVFAEQITEYLREARERRDAPAPPALRPAPAPAADNGQELRLATVKNGKSERLARLLAAAVEETPDEFQEFLLPPTPASPFAPVADAPNTDQFLADIPKTSDAAPDIKLSRSTNSFTSDDVPTYEFDTTADQRRSLRRDDTPFESAPGTRLVPFTVRDDDASVVDVAPARNVAGSIVAPRMRKRAHRAQSSQDEWGFFDPSQCGFPALIAKLDEIAARESGS
jgi:hypothetical protein